MPALSPQQPSAPRVMGVPARIVLVAMILLALFVGMAKPTDSGNASMQAGEHVGVLLVLLGLPALIAFLVAGRRKVRHPNRFVLVFCIASGIFTLGNAAALVVPEPPVQRFARLMREAAGTQPVRHAWLPGQRRFDDAVRDQYGKLLQLNRDYTEEVKSMDRSEIKFVNAPRSFASAEAARPGLEQLHALYQADVAQEQHVQQALNALRGTLEELSSPADRDGIVKGFDGAMAPQLARRQQALAAEKAWVDALDDEHAYADSHSDSIAVIDNKVVIKDPGVRGEFNARMDLQEEKRKAFIQVQADFQKYQAEALNKMGLSRKDVGK